MASFKCSGCGRTDFFTSHGFAKHGKKCARKSVSAAMAPIYAHNRERQRQKRSNVTRVQERFQEEGTWKAFLSLPDGHQRLGTVEATDDATAMARAIKKFNLDPVDEQYLSVSPAS